MLSSVLLFDTYELRCSKSQQHANAHSMRFGDGPWCTNTNCEWLSTNHHCNLPLQLRENIVDKSAIYSLLFRRNHNHLYLKSESLKGMGLVNTCPIPLWITTITLTLLFAWHVSELEFLATIHRTSAYQLIHIY